MRISIWRSESIFRPSYRGDHWRCRRRTTCRRRGPRSLPDKEAASSLVVVAQTRNLVSSTAPAAELNPLLSKNSAPEHRTLARFETPHSAVGRNPIAGTMFDSAAREATWVGGCSQLQVATDEQTIAAKIHELESNESTAAQAQDALQSCPEDEMPNPWAVQLLRPAERHLEEAAQLLEEAGQYGGPMPPAPLAQDIRRDARKLEMQRPPVSLPSTLIYGPPAGR